jgi:hypothetical protein
VRSRALDAVVTSFVDDITNALIAATRPLGEVDVDALRASATSEAFDLCTAMIDADQRHTSDELEALIDAFGHRLPETRLLLATPETLRGSALVQGRRHWVEEDSELFGILTDADRRHGTDLAVRYYERALDVAHVIASLDVVPARAELEAISALRTRLLAAMPRRPGGSRAPDDAPSAQDGATDGTDATAAVPPAAEEDPPPRPLEELLAELDELVGLDGVK